MARDIAASRRAPNVKLPLRKHPSKSRLELSRALKRQSARIHVALLPNFGRAASSSLQERRRREGERGVRRKRKGKGRGSAREGDARGSVGVALQRGPGGGHLALEEVGCDQAFSGTLRRSLEKRHREHGVEPVGPR